MAKVKTPRKKQNGMETMPPTGASIEMSPEIESVKMASAPAEPVSSFTGNGDTRNGDMKNTIRKTTHKPEIVKAESRANVLPINLEDEIRRQAYLYSERRGFEPGHETEDWLAAEHEVRSRYHQPSMHMA